MRLVSNSPVVYAAALAAVALVVCLGTTAVARADDAFDARLGDTQAYVRHQTLLTYEQLPVGQFPRMTRPDGSWEMTGPMYWSSGYFPGSLWLQYERGAEGGWRQAAVYRQEPIADVPPDATHEDSGVRFYQSYVNGYRLTGTRAMRLTALPAAAATAARFDSRIGLLRSRNTTEGYQVVVDELMNLQLLYWGARNGGPSEWRSIAMSHALNTIRDFVRTDGTTYHLNVYDESTGQFVAHEAGQGAAADSTWSRGQAWAIYGFSNAYRETGDARFLATARLVADRYLATLPEDLVPYWDFDAADTPGEPRDSSAAAIAGSALVDLSLLETDTACAARYAQAARDIVASLSTDRYLTRGLDLPSVLWRGTYDKPHRKPVDTGLTWGDYFFEEAILRMRSLPVTGTPLTVVQVRESGHTGTDVAARAVDGREKTRWFSNGDQWIEFDLGVRQPVHKISIATYSSANRSAAYTFTYSSSRRSWTPMTSVKTGGRWGGWETYDLPDESARFIRIRCAGTTAGPVNGISEVRIY